MPIESVLILKALSLYPVSTITGIRPASIAIWLTKNSPLPSGKERSNNIMSKVLPDFSKPLAAIKVFACSTLG